MIVEKSFPRGGLPAKDSKQSSSKRDNIIFGALQAKIKKPKRVKETFDPEELLEQQKNDVIETRSAELLNYETIQDGMVIMGIVSAVDELFLTVSLPGRMNARISALEISEAYTKAAREFLENNDNAKNYKTLQDLYEVGQLVYGRVQEVKQKNKFAKPAISMTLKPAEVHAELIHSKIRKGFIFNGAIAEVQEHGYVIESGIRSLRAFLPSNQAQEGLALGQLVYLKVDKMTIDTAASTCICKQLQPDQMKVKSVQSEPNIDYILPSSIVNFQVTKHLKDGLQGTIMNEAFTAYVNEHQLGEPLMLPEDYEIMNKYNARILYVMPLTKLIYLTLNLQKFAIKSEQNNADEQAFKRGDIIEDARVHHIGTGGIVLVLKNQFKGLISYKTIKANYKGNYDQDELLNKYSKKSKHTVRVLGYDIMDSMYICSDDTKVVKENYFSLDDIKPGDFTTALVKSFNSYVGGYNVEVGRIKGIIEKLYLMPGGNKQYEPNSKIRCRILGVSPERNKVYLTNRVEYMAKNCKLLMSLDDAKRNHTFMGTIVKAAEDYYLVKFFNDITGLLFKNNLSDAFLSEQSASLEEGQTMLFRILSKNGTKLTLSLVEDVCELGEICTGTVTHVLQTGLEVNVQRNTTENDDESSSDNANIKGIVPIRLLSDFLDLLAAKSRIYTPNAQIRSVSLQRNIFSIRDVAYFEEFGIKDWNSVAPGDILRAFIENVNEEIIELFVPIRGYGKLVKIHIKMLLLQAYNVKNIMLHPEQVIYVKVVGKEASTKTISVTAKLTSVWDKQLSSTASYIDGYLTEIAEIRKALKKQGAPISKLNIGDKITVIFNSIDSETKNWQYQEEKSKILAIAKASIMTGCKMKPPQQGAKQEAIILWIDYSAEQIYISSNPADIKHIIKSKILPEELSNAQQVSAKVLLKLDHVLICSLKKGPNPLVYCPIRMHYNDFENSASAEVKEGDFCKLAFIHKTRPIAVLQRTWSLWHETNNKKRKTSINEEETNPPKAKQKKLETAIAETPTLIGKKMKLLTNDTTVETSAKRPKLLQSKETTSDTNTPAEFKNKKEVETKKSKLNKTAKIDHEEEEDEAIESTKSSSLLFYEDKTPHAPKPKPLTSKTLAGVSDFWSTDLSQLDTSNAAISSDDDDDDNDESAAANDSNKQKKKRLSAVENFKQQREEEARLREIEAKYADPNHLPETVDQFDRLVLSEPNNSKHWINYMVFHLQSAEIDKARAVARRAIKAIAMRNVDDHLNIWVALLNLEIRYGSRESFDTSLKEALIVNEPIKVYLRVMEILREANKQQELIEMVGIVTKKFKGKQDVWKAAAEAYFSIGMSEKAQQMLHKSLASLPEREHVNTIVMFANLNHRHGCTEMAQTLLDQVVTSYPKRVDVWTQYVDMLVKDKLIDSARSVLERAILQKIPLKKMRTIFKKYLEFEERHGTEADVEKVKRLATEYVKQNSSIE